ncbi:MAG: alpha/beta hydrolase family protein [Candidatus Helarchaeota archaeon]
MGKISSLNFRKYLLLIGIGLIILGFIFAPYDSFKTDIRPQKVSFPSKYDGVTITGDLYFPKNYSTGKSYPAVVLVHGINDKAKRHQHLAIEFVRRGFIALGINLRGHDGSDGICSLSAYEPWDIMGAADYLSTYNISNLGLVGHSLGGMSAIRAAHNDTRFNATVVMGPPISIDALLSRVVSDVDSLLQYAWMLSFKFDLSDPYERYIRAPVFWINQTSPKNFFYVLGGADTAATVPEALLCIQNATGLSSVTENVTYGVFASGNASRLRVYPGITHGAEPTTPEIIVDTVLWMENAFNITNGDLTTEDLIQWNLNSQWSILILSGFLISIFPSISYICTAFLKPNAIEKPKIGQNLKTKKIIISIGIYTGIFILASVITLPLIELFRYSSWSRYNVAGLLANVLSIQTLFLAIGLFIVLHFEKRKYNMSWVDFGLNKATTLRAALSGLAISAILIVGYFIIPYIPTTYLQYPRYWVAFLLLFLNYLIISIIGEIYLRGLIQTKLFKPSSRIKNWFRLILIALIGGIIQGIAVFFVLLPMENFTVTYGSFSLNLELIGLVGGTLIFTGIGLLNAWIFHKTQHILTAAIVQAFLLSWFLVTFMVPM